jgi:exonuclease SbcD
MLRILHTSDWHLGHRLRDFSRAVEHERFLSWLLNQFGVHRVDALLVAGDIFESSNPSAEAQRRFYDFLGAARDAYPDLDIVIIGGNHDSARRLEAAEALLSRLQIQVVGGVRPGRSMVMPLRDAQGEVAAWVCAVPYLRVSDLPAGAPEGTDPLVWGVQQIYGEVVADALARRTPNQALVGMGHAYMVQGKVSELSERKILRGNEHALPVTLFPEQLAYVALGHLHLAQAIGGEARIRYSGSPIPLSMSEIEYPHQVCLVTLDGPDFKDLKVLPVPRFVPLQRIPEDGPKPLAKVLIALDALPNRQGTDPDDWPFVEAQVRLDKPAPGLRQQVEMALKDKAVRLVRIRVERVGDNKAAADAYAEQTLSELTPEQVFIRRYQKEFPDQPSAELLASFHQMVEAASGEVSE